MDKKTLLKFVNPILLVLIVNQLATGFKPRLYGLGTFRLMHRRMAVVLSMVLVAHLALNFAWMKNTYWKARAKKAP
jgi:hypothetical protein